MRTRVLAFAIAVLLAGGIAARFTVDEPPTSHVAAVHEEGVGVAPPTLTAAPSTTSTVRLPSTTPPSTTLFPRPSVPVALSGCPVPPRPPGPPSPPAWRPPVLVPDSEIPVPTDPVPWVSDTRVVRGKGMWIWKMRRTENGDAAAIVRRAEAAGLRQLWVRVGDSQDGFYAADFLSDLVPRAHRRGIAVLGWGFPYLWDPAGDAAWTRAALAWRAPEGAALDGFSPDVETSAEGVAITDRRVALYLSIVRDAAGARPVVATVYRPTDRYWLGSYPYRTIARYVDAFAPMVYWGCTEPGDAVTQALERLRTLRPVHVIGQGYDMAEDGGRHGSPSPEEAWRFLDVAQRGGALGASFWVWQSMEGRQWEILTAFPWSGS